MNLENNGLTAVIIPQKAQDFAIEDSFFLFELALLAFDEFADVMIEPNALINFQTFANKCQDVFNLPEKGDEFRRKLDDYITQCLKSYCTTNGYILLTKGSDPIDLFMLVDCETHIQTH
jgi:hypothetical protein